MELIAHDYIGDIEYSIADNSIVAIVIRSYRNYNGDLEADVLIHFTGPNLIHTKQNEEELKSLLFYITDILKFHGIGWHHEYDNMHSENKTILYARDGAIAYTSKKKIPINLINRTNGELVVGFKNSLSAEFYFPFVDKESDNPESSYQLFKTIPKRIMTEFRKKNKLHLLT